MAELGYMIGDSVEAYCRRDAVGRGFKLYVTALSNGQHEVQVTCRPGLHFYYHHLQGCGVHQHVHEVRFTTEPNTLWETVQRMLLLDLRRVRPCGLQCTFWPVAEMQAVRDALLEVQANPPLCRGCGKAVGIADLGVLRAIGHAGLPTTWCHVCVLTH